jgi:type I restriction enzyme S subunit
MSSKVERTIGELGRYINGRGFKPGDWGKVGLPIVRIANLNSPDAPYDYYSGPLDDGHRIDTGDIIVSWSATLDAFRWDRGPAALNQHSFKVLPNESIVDREYLFYVLKTAMVRISDLVHGATMKHVTRPEFEGCKLWIHKDKSDQVRIAARLKAQLAEVETARQAAQAQLRDAALLRQRLLRQTFDDLADVPHKVLGEWATTTSGSTPARGDKRYWSPAEIPWVKTGEVAFAPIFRTEEAISKQALAECSLMLLPPKSVLIAMYGQGKTRGQSAILEIEATTNQACFAILPNDTWDADFLHHWLMASYDDLRSLSDGRGGNQANLNGGLLNALEIPAPDIDDQRRIVARLRQQLAEADALRAALEQQLRDLDALPQRILAQAFEN